MKYTGERFIPGEQGDIALEHYQRYMFARNLVAGKVVLDVGSGEGYGSYLLSQVAKNVIGIDVSEEAVKHASSKYEGANVEYRNANCTDLEGVVDEGSVDVVVFFEALEHIDGESQAKALKEIKKALNEGGVLLISTPNKPVYNEMAGQEQNIYHLNELTLAEFRGLLHNHFRLVKIFGQKVEIASFLWTADLASGLPKTSCNLLSDDGPLIGSSLPEPDKARYFIAVCSDNSVPLQLELDILLYKEMKEVGHRDELIRLKDEYILHLETSLKNIYSSNSWKLTAPLRRLMGIFNKS